MDEKVTIFHVDRARQLEKNQEIELATSYAGWPDDLKIVMEDFYPEGISVHGNQYLSDIRPDTQVLNYVSEWVFELIRQNEFPEKPSRFQSIFGAPTLDNAEEFVNQRADKETVIWRIECEKTHRGDMKLLQVNNFPDCVRNARNYWHGETFLEEPFWEIIGELPATVVGKEKEYEPKASNSTS